MGKRKKKRKKHAWSVTVDLTNFFSKCNISHTDMVFLHVCGQYLRLLINFNVVNRFFFLKSVKCCVTFDIIVDLKMKYYLH